MEIPSWLGAAAAVIAFLIGRRDRHQNAVRAYAETFLVQRLKIGGELLAAATLRIGDLHSAFLEHKANREAKTPEDVERTVEQIKKRNTESLPKTYERWNTAYSAAIPIFSDQVRAATQRIVRLNNAWALNSEWEPAAADEALKDLHAALRSDLRIEDVLKFQDRLFSSRWRLFGS